MDPSLQVLPVPGVNCPKRLCGVCGEAQGVRRDNCTPKGWRYWCRPCEARRSSEAYARRKARMAADPVYAAERREAAKRNARVAKSRLYRDPVRHAKNLDTQKAWRERSNNRRNAVLKHKYGITIADYERMLEAQGGRCDICRTDDPGQNQESRYSFHVDHCHETGVVRGLLCDRCNRGLGFFFDNADRLSAAVLYLRKHELGAATA
jgi:hypothetical protein